MLLPAHEHRGSWQLTELAVVTVACRMSAQFLRNLKHTRVTNYCNAARSCAAYRHTKIRFQSSIRSLSSHFERGSVPVNVWLV